jgi:hypothetical protein
MSVDIVCRGAQGFRVAKRVALGLALTLALGLASTSSYAQSPATSDHGIDAAKGAGQNTAGAVNLVLTNFRDGFQSSLKRIPGAPGLAAFSADPSRQTIYAHGYDPFESMALGYAKGMPTKARPQPAAPPSSWLYSIWAQASTDYEKRTYDSLGLPAVTKNQSNTGVVGFDVVKIGVATASDAFVIGGFYTETSTHTAQTSGGVGLNPAATRSVTPGGGIYASYIVGGFSADFSFVYTATNSRFIGITNQPRAAGTFAGFRDTDGLSFNFNMQYKYDLSKDWWVEPTIGFSVTESHANQAGTANTDGNVRRFQGGARVGTEWSWGAIRVQPTVGGYVASDVNVETIHPLGFFFALPTDQGYLWVKGTGKLNFQWTDKFSTSIEGEARHRANVDGYAGRFMARYTF